MGTHDAYILVGKRLKVKGAMLPGGLQVKGPMLPGGLQVKGPMLPGGLQVKGPMLPGGLQVKGPMLPGGYPGVGKSCSNCRGCTVYLKGLIFSEQQFCQIGPLLQILSHIEWYLEHKWGSSSRSRVLFEAPPYFPFTMVQFLLLSSNYAI